MSIKDVAARTLELNANIAIIISVYRGNPGKIWFLYVTENSYQWIPPDILLAGVKLQREFGPIKISTPHKLAIMVSKEAEEEQKKLAESLSKILESTLIYGSPNQENNIVECKTKGFDIILYINSDPQFKAVLKFIQTANNIEIGPRIRIKKMFWQIKRVSET